MVAIPADLLLPLLSNALLAAVIVIASLSFLAVKGRSDEDNVISSQEDLVAVTVPRYQ